MLSKLSKVEDRLDGNSWVARRFVRFIDPLPQIPMDKEIQAQQRNEVREAPLDAAAHLQILENEDGDQCCPNLDAHRVGAGADKGFDLELLLEQFEKEFRRRHAVSRRSR